MRLYRKRLKTFMEYVGEPDVDAERDNVFLVISIIYMLFLGLILCFGDSKILAMIGYDKGIVRLIVIGILLGFVYVMFLCWLILMNKKSRNEKGKRLTSKECWRIIKILFVAVYLFQIVKDCILYVLGKPRQGIVINYLAEMAIAFLLSGLLVSLEFFLVTQCLIPICLFLKISVSVECVCLIIVISAIGSFFLFSENLSHFSIAWEIRHKMKKELEEKKIINVEKLLMSKPMKRKMEQIKSKKCEEFDEQFKQTRLLVYVVLIFLLLVVPKESLSIYENIFIDQFMGVATLAALLREVKGNR